SGAAVPNPLQRRDRAQGVSRCLGPRIGCRQEGCGPSLLLAYPCLSSSGIATKRLIFAGLCWHASFVVVSHLLACCFGRCRIDRLVVSMQIPSGFVSLNSRWRTPRHCPPISGRQSSRNCSAGPDSEPLPEASNQRTRTIPGPATTLCPISLSISLSLR